MLGGKLKVNLSEFVLWVPKSFCEGVKVGR